MAANDFTEFAVFKLDKAWHSVNGREADAAKLDFTKLVRTFEPKVRTLAYNLTGLKVGADLLLLIKADSAESIQDMAAKLMSTEFGVHLDMVYSFLGLSRKPVYAKDNEAQLEQKEHGKYLVFYPFTKTIDWYLLSKEERSGMMNEHINLGKKFKSVSQELIYSFGLDDQEFVVAYETNNLAEFQDAVMALREVRVRRYTARETPVFVCVYRPLEQAIRYLG